MKVFKQLIDIYNSFLVSNGSRNVTEYGVLIHIGYYEQLDQPLNLKSLLLLNLGPKATVERTVKTLINDGKVIKVASPSDRRNNILLLSEDAKNTVYGFHKKIRDIITAD